MREKIKKKKFAELASKLNNLAEAREMSQWVREGLLHMHKEGRSSFVLSYPESPTVDANKKPRRRLGGVLGRGGLGVPTFLFYLF